MILTDEEVRDALALAPKMAPNYAGWVADQKMSNARAIEQAILSRLANGVSVEPVAKVVLTETLGLPCMQWLGLDKQFDFVGGEHLYTASAIAAARAQVIEEAARISEKHFHSTTAKQIRALIGKAST